MSNFPYANFNNVDKINMAPVQSNGRISLMEQPPKEIQFAMFERVAKQNRAIDYRAPANNNGLEDNLLSYAFFSGGNIQILQNGLRAGVYNLSEQNFSIPPQNSDQLVIIMRTMYYQYAKFNQDPISQQVAALNNRVLEYVVPFLYNEAVAYYKYIRDQSTLVIPLERAAGVDRDFKELDMRSEIGFSKDL